MTTTHQAAVNTAQLSYARHIPCHTVRYVPSRHAARPPAASAFTPVHRDISRPKATTNTTIDMIVAHPTTRAVSSSAIGHLFGQQRSAFTAVLPRVYSNCTDSPEHLQYEHHHQFSESSSTDLSMSRLANIQRSNTKLFTRNELLKLLVSKQMKNMHHAPDNYKMNHVQQQQRSYQNDAIDLSHRSVKQQNQQPDSTSCTPSGRLLELSSVIKTINGTKTTSNNSRKDTNTTPASSAETAEAVSTKTIQQKFQKITDHHQAHLQHCNVGLTALIAQTTTAATTSQNSSTPIVGRTKPLVFRCDWSDCNRTFATAEQWTIHVTHTHVIADTDDGLYYCQWRACPRAPNGFNARYKMLIHVRSHTNDKPYRCPHCAKSFLRSETLRIHKRIHFSDKLFACKFLGCTKRYTDPSSLRKHVKTKNHIVIMV